MSTVDSIHRPARRFRSPWALLGPAFVAAVAYVDPGNVATNVTAGVGYGYRLLWVLVAANLIAFLVQYLSAKLGLVTGLSLPEALRERMPRAARLLYWGQAELVAAATDLAEVIGGAIALNLLFDVPLLVGGIITAIVSTALLTIQDRFGQRPFERVVIGLLLIIAIGFVAGVVVAPPSWGQAAGGLVPTFDGTQSVLLAAGMLGATVMPHVVYLHSALSRDRFGKLDRTALPRHLAATRVDVGIAMLVAGAVNISMLLVAAASLSGRGTIEGIAGAHVAIGQLLGHSVAVLFALGLLASGLASTSVGCYAGAVIMDGLLRIRIPLLLRRVATLVPAVVILALGADPTMALVVSQVVLSFGIPFALIPLVRLTSDRTLMAEHANGRLTVVAAWGVAAVVIVLNALLLVLTISG
jgi:manganese transport protein